MDTDVPEEVTPEKKVTLKSLLKILTQLWNTKDQILKPDPNLETVC